MTLTLTYGNGICCSFDAGEPTFLRPAMSKSLSADQVAAAVQAALREPLGYPPLSRAVVPSDLVVLALDANVPELQRLVDGVLSVLQESGVEPDCITALTTNASLETTLAAVVQCEVHDLGDEKQCAFLGVDASGRAVRFNRTICEADLVLPIGCCTADFSQQPTKYPGLFPQFSNRETNDRYWAPVAKDSRVHREQRIEEANQAGWRLGVGLVVHVVPSAEGGVAEVFAGDPIDVAKAASERYRSIWACEAPRRGDLVVASLTGEQTWQTFGRALLAAERVLEEHGTIAIVSELAEPLGPSLQRLCGSDDFATAEREIMRDRAADSWPAMVLARALEQGSVYLRSELAGDVVESLGMTPISSDAELSRLASAGTHCVVLEHAQRLTPAVANEASHCAESSYLDG